MASGNGVTTLQFAFSLARDEAEACDLTQQTFLHLGPVKGHNCAMPQSENLAVHHLAP